MVRRDASLGDGRYDRSAAWVRLEMSQHVLVTLARAFGDVGIDVLAVKGVVTAGSLYEPGERPLTDVDVRIRPEHLARALARAEQAGWEIIRYTRTSGNLVLRTAGVAVDVECHVGPPSWATVSVGQMFDRATRDARGFWVPDIHDHALLLTLNVFKDKLTLAMPWAIDDVVRIVDAPGFDVATYVDRVGEARVSAPAWIVADWMTERYEHATWGRIREHLGGDTPTRGRYARLMRRWLVPGNEFALPVRVLARAASDDLRRWPLALGLSVAWELESRYDAHRRERSKRAAP